MEEQGKRASSEPRVMESASGVTSPDGANTGVKLLAIAAAELLLAAFVLSNLVSCVTWEVGRALVDGRGTLVDAWEGDGGPRGQGLVDDEGELDFSPTLRG